MSYDVLFGGEAEAVAVRDVTELLAIWSEAAFVTDRRAVAAEKRSVTKLFWHASQKSWMHAGRRFKYEKETLLSFRVVQHLPCDSWAAQQQQRSTEPVLAIEAVPVKWRAKVKELSPRTTDFRAVVADRATQYGRLPSATLRTRSRRRPSLKMVMLAACLARSTDDKLSLAAWRTFSFVGTEHSIANKQSIRASGLSTQKCAAIEALDGLAPEFWATLWLRSTRQVLEDLTSIKHISHKTVACLLMYGMQRPVVVVDRNVSRACHATFGLSEKTPTDVIFWWLMSSAPAGLLFDLSLLLLEEGRTRTSSSGRTTKRKREV